MEQEIGNFPHSCCADNQEDWACFLNMCRTNYGTQPSSSVIKLPFPHANPTDTPAVEQKFRQTKQAWETPYQCLEQVAQEMVSMIRSQFLVYVTNIPTASCTRCSLLVVIEDRILLRLYLP